MTDARDAAAFPVVKVWSNLGTVWALEGEVAEYEALDFTPEFNGLGSWTLDLSYGSDQATLFERDRLVTIDWRGRRSTWTIVPHESADEESGQPQVEVSGVGALSWLGRELAWPDPTKDINSQPVLSDTDPAPYRGLPAETVIKQLVAANTVPVVASGTTWVRSGTSPITVPTSLGLGSIQPARPVFDNLLELVANLANLGGIGVDVGLVNVGDANSTRANLTLLVWAPEDHTRDVLLTDAAGTLDSWDQVETAPTATMAVVAGGGTGGVDRVRQVVTTAASVAAANDWGGHRVVFVDGPSSFDPDELRQAGEQALLDGAATRTLALTSSESEGQLAFYDFYVGDKATAELATGASAQDAITSIQVSVSTDDGINVAPTFGNPDAGDADLDMADQMIALKQAVRGLQRK